MTRFWNRYVQPLIETVRPARILEIGADAGLNTRNILDYCRRSGAKADIVDPAPRPGLHEVLAQYDGEYRYYPLKSLMAIPQVDVPDIALVDGDHNWATVYSELNLLHAAANDAGVAPPIVISHDVAWPYGRRDMYYSPDDLEPSQRHPYAYRGMLPGVSELVEHGMNGVLANALHEGGPRNGVLTAIEDYLAGNGEGAAFHVLPFFNGLGILVPTARMTPALQARIDSFYTPEHLLETCQAIEVDAMYLRALLTETQTRLTRRTEALERARALLEVQRERIELLEQTATRASSESV